VLLDHVAAEGGEHRGERHGVKDALAARRVGDHGLPAQGGARAARVAGLQPREGFRHGLEQRAAPIGAAGMRQQRIAEAAVIGADDDIAHDRQRFGQMPQRRLVDRRETFLVIQGIDSGSTVSPILHRPTPATLRRNRSSPATAGNLLDPFILYDMHS
jgi:hypothetical protein